MSDAEYIAYADMMAMLAQIKNGEMPSHEAIQRMLDRAMVAWRED